MCDAYLNQQFTPVGCSMANRPLVATWQHYCSNAFVFDGSFVHRQTDSVVASVWALHNHVWRRVAYLRRTAGLFNMRAEYGPNNM
jgi:hypothetical protein